MKHLFRILAAALLLPCSGFAQSVPDLSALTSPASGDLLYIVDVSDTTDGAAGSGRRITVGNLSLAITPAWSGITGTPTTISGYGITDGLTVTGNQTTTNKTLGTGTKTLLGSDATGDIYYRAATTALLTRLGIGTSGQVLTVAGGLPGWAAPAAAWGAITGTPTTLAGYGITDAQGLDADLTAFVTNASWSGADLTMTGTVGATGFFAAGGTDGLDLSAGTLLRASGSSTLSLTADNTIALTSGGSTIVLTSASGITAAGNLTVTGTVSASNLTLAGNLGTTGAFNTTFAQQANCVVTVPNAATAAMARTDAAQTFTGVQTFSSSPVMPGINPSGSFSLTTTSSGTIAISGSNGLTLSSPNGGGTTITSGSSGGVTITGNNGVTISATGGACKISGLTVNTTTGTLVIANSSSLTTTGAFATTFAAIATATHTLPGSSSTLARTDAAQTISGTQTFSGSISMATGSAASPSFAFTGDTNTGMYRIGVDTIGFSTGATERVRIDDTGVLTVAGAVVIGGGTSIAKVRSVVKSAFDCPSIAGVGGVQTTTMTVTDAITANCTVGVGLPAGGIDAGVIVHAYVSAADIVTLVFTNTTAGAIDPASADYRVIVTRF